MKGFGSIGRLDRVPVHFFAIPFGIAGLALVWRQMSTLYGSPPAIRDALFLIAAIVWALFLAGTLARLLPEPRRIFAELRDPALSPFWSLPPIVGMLLALGLEPHAYGAAKIVFVVFFLATILFGGWITGDWILSRLDPAEFHPGYFLPTVAGGFIGGEGCAAFGMDGLGWLSFGFGIVCWLMLGSLIVNRLFFTRMLPAPLVPTLAIELAPPAVGGSAYFALHGAVPDTLAYALAGYAALMILVQLRLLPLFVRLEFSPGFWAFTFSWMAVGVLALRWLAIEHPPAASLYAGLVAGAASLLIAAIGARSALAIARGQFLPPPSAGAVQTDRAPDRSDGYLE